MAINSFNDIPTYSRHSGFTLLELTIVLVIIGLVAGGVLIGKDMIESSKVRAQVSQLQEYSTAVNTFKLKYNYLPGDMPWIQRQQFGLGTAGGGGWNPNGDGLLNSDTTPGQYGYMATQEHSFFFQNLGKSGLIASKYCSSPYNYNEDGIAVAGSCNYTTYDMVGKSFPTMKLNNQLGIVPYHSRDFGGHWWALGIRTYNFWLGSACTDPSLTPVQALQLDSKMDDGIPGTGIVKAVKDASGTVGGVNDSWLEVDNLPATGCVTSAASIAYNAANTNIVCQVIVKWQ